jgi:hypothetical protein
MATMSDLKHYCARRVHEELSRHSKRVNAAILIELLSVDADDFVYDSMINQLYVGFLDQQDSDPSVFVNYTRMRTPIEIVKLTKPHEKSRIDYASYAIKSDKDREVVAETLIESARRRDRHKFCDCACRLHPYSLAEAVGYLRLADIRPSGRMWSRGPEFFLWKVRDKYVARRRFVRDHAHAIIPLQRKSGETLIDVLSGERSLEVADAPKFDASRIPQLQETQYLINQIADQSAEEICDHLSFVLDQRYKHVDIWQDDKAGRTLQYYESNVVTLFQSISISFDPPNIIISVSLPRQTSMIVRMPIILDFEDGKVACGMKSARIELKESML